MHLVLLDIELLSKKAVIMEPNLINYRGYTEHSNSNLSYLGILRSGVKLGFSILIRAWKAEQ